MDKSVVVLASGGLDSTLVMLLEARKGKEVIPMFTDYGQFSYPGEKRSIDLVTNWINSDKPFNLEPLVEVAVEFSDREMMAACPGRMLTFVGNACIWLFSEGYQYAEIALGIHMGDKDQDSCRVGYETALNEAVKVLTQGCVEITTPLMGMSRSEIGEGLHHFGIPFDLMYNCYWYPPCGWQSINMDYRCPGCRRKEEVMNELGLEVIVGPNTDIMPIGVARRDWKKLR